MAYYCFLCNENHVDSLTEEHFIPKSLDGPKNQWLPVCENGNARANSIFDNDARDLLYLARVENTGALKRSGEALLEDGTLKRFKFNYHVDSVPERKAAFRYIYDRETNMHIPSKHVYAIAFPVGLIGDERTTYCKGIAKMSIGSIVYLLKKQGVKDSTLRRILMQESINAIRHFALDLQWSGQAVAMRFSLGRSDVLERLQGSCENKEIRNHVLKIDFQKNNIHVEGMLYSQYGWVLDFLNRIPIEERELCLKNPIAHINAPDILKDVTLSHDSICILNPDFEGREPEIPHHWRNN